MPVCCEKMKTFDNTVRLYRAVRLTSARRRAYSFSVADGDFMGIKVLGREIRDYGNDNSIPVKLF